jgi:hypothetical protein
MLKVKTQHQIEEDERIEVNLGEILQVLQAKVSLQELL